ncbi:MAG: TonB-dependent receptor [Gammaproteobacteria bacterium]
MQGKVSGRSVVLCMAMAGFVLSVSAQTVLEEITVTARKRAESYEDVPIAVNAFTAEEIESAGIDTPQDFIALTPNVTQVQTQNQGTSFVTIRGISQARNSETSVAILVDGVLETNPAQFNQQLFDVEDIQVLKGPQGALYGRDAIGGAIIIRTKQPTDEYHGKLKVGGDNGPGYKVQASLSGPVPGMDTLKFRGAFSYVDTDGVIDNPVLREEADPFRDVSGRFKLLWQPTDNFSADARFSISQVDTQGFYFNIRNSAPPLFPGAPAVLGLGNKSSVNDTSLPVRVNNAGDDDRDLLNFSLKLDYTSSYGTLTSITAYDRTKEIITGDAFDFLPTAESFNETVLSPIFLGLPVGAIPDFNQSQYLDVDAFSQEIRFTSPAENRFRWIAGIYFVLTDRFISTGNMVDTGGGVFKVFRSPRGNFPFDFATDPVNPQATFLSDSQDNFAFAAFGEMSFDIDEDLELSFALRYDRDHRQNTTDTPNAFFAGNLVGASFQGEVRQRTWDDLQPKITLRFRPMENLMFYGSFSRGFRSGGFNQSGVSAAGVPGVGDTFDQETANTIEGGLKAQLFDKRLNLSLSAFDTRAEGSNFFVFLVASSTQNLGNFDAVDFDGIEFEVAARLAEGLDLNVGLGYTKSNISESKRPTDIGNRAPNVSKYTANVTGKYERPLFAGIDGFVRVDYQYIGNTSFFDADANNVPVPTNNRKPLNLVDLRFGVRGSDWSVTAWSKNLNDLRYNAEYSPGGFVFKAPPRRWGVDFMKEF